MCVGGAKDPVMKHVAMNMDATPGLLGTFMQAQPLRAQNLITCIVFYSSVTSCLYTLAYLAFSFYFPSYLEEFTRKCKRFGRSVCFVVRFQKMYFWLFSADF